MRAFNRFLLAGTSHLAILMMGAGAAMAGAGDGLSFDTDSAGGGSMTNAATGTSYSSGTNTLTVNGAQTGTGSQHGLRIYGAGTAISNLNVDVGTNLLGGSTCCGGIGMHTTGGTVNITIQNGVRVAPRVSDYSAAVEIGGGSVLNSLVNRGTIEALSGEHNTGIGLDNGSLTTLTNYGTISSENSSPISAVNGSMIGTINNERGGVISSRFVSMSLQDMTSGVTVNNSGIINGGFKFGTAGTNNVYLNAGSTMTGDIDPNTSTTNVSVGASGPGTVSLSGNWGSSGSPLHALSILNGSTLALLGDSQLHYNNLITTGDVTYDMGTHRLGWVYYPTGNGDTDQIGGGISLKTTIDTVTNQHGYVVFSRGAGTGSGDEVISGPMPPIYVTVVGTVTTGSRYVVIQDTEGRVSTSLPNVANGGGYRWSVSQVIGTGQTDTDGVSYGTGYNNYVLTATNQNAAGSATGTNGSGVRALATYSGNDAGLQALSQAVNNLTSDAEIKKAGAQLRPETTGNTAQASMGAVTQALSTIQVRTDAVRVAASETGTGVSSGETLKGLGVWGQGFGSTASQNERNDVSGYDANTYGLAFGADFKVIDPLRVGLSFAYAQTNVDSSGDRSGSGQDINSYITSLYGSYSGKGWYVDGALTYGIHKYDATRAVAIAGASAQSLNADYSGQQYGAKAEIGVPLAVGPAVVTPLVSLAYNNLKQDSYSETGGSAALQVGSSSTDSIRSGLGAKASHKVATIGNWEISPNARAVWYHEFNKSSQEQTSAYVAGGSSFITPGSDIATEHFNLGLGVDIASVRNTTISAKYDADLADKYVSHSASLQLRTEF